MFQKWSFPKVVHRIIILIWNPQAHPTSSFDAEFNSVLSQNPTSKNELMAPEQNANQKVDLRVSVGAVFGK